MAAQTDAAQPHGPQSPQGTRCAIIATQQIVPRQNNTDAPSDITAGQQTEHRDARAVRRPAAYMEQPPPRAVPQSHHVIYRRAAASAIPAAVAHTPKTVITKNKNSPRTRGFFILNLFNYHYCGGIIVLVGNRQIQTRIPAGQFF